MCDDYVLLYIIYKRDILFYDFILFLMRHYNIKLLIKHLGFYFYRHATI